MGDETNIHIGGNSAEISKNISGRQSSETTRTGDGGSYEYRPDVGDNQIHYKDERQRETPAPRQQQGSGYVGQDFDLGQEISMRVQGNEDVTRRPMEVTNNVKEELNTRLPIAKQNAAMAGLTPVRESDMDPSDLHGVRMKHQEGEVPVLSLPTEMPAAESKRERAVTIDEAYDAGDPTAEFVIGSSVFGDSSNNDFEAATLQSKFASNFREGKFQEQFQRVSKNSADKAIKQEEQRVDNANKPWWMNPADRLIRFSQESNIRPKDIIDAVKKRTANAFKRSGVGNRIYGKMLGYKHLDFQEVGLGIQEIMAVVKQDPSMLENLLLTVMDEVPNLSMMSSVQIADLINSNDLWVATFKPPNNQGQDIQRRKLRILKDQQRGIFLHNIMAAMYTADYDGDDMEVSLDPDVAKLAKDPTDYLVDIYGKVSLNSDFMSVAEIQPTNGMSVEEYVRDVILGNFTYQDREIKSQRGNTWQANSANIAQLVDAIIELGKTEKKDGDAQSNAWGDMFREARKYADKRHPNSKQASDKMMSDICRAVFDNMQSIKYYNTLTTIGSDVLVISDGYVPRPVTYGDAVLYKVIDGMVNGQLPNNFQELKLLLTGFTGNVEGKNAPFRFTADVGKMMKMDERLQVGNGYVVDPNNDEKMKLFFQTTVKFAGSMKMAKEIKSAGRSDYYTRIMRKMVIDEVGFPSDARYMGDFQAFMRAFVKSYNYHSATINEANLVFLTNMGLATENNGVVSPIGKTGKDNKGNIVDYTLSDVAEPILSIYGTYSVAKFFNQLSDNGLMKIGNRDPYFVGNPNATKRQWDRSYEREYDNRFKENFWITGRYADYSLRQFRNENHFITKQNKINGVDELEVARNRKISELDGINSIDTDVEAQFELLLAIADKKTGAMSKFNESVYGGMEQAHRADEKTTVQYMSTILTSVQKAMREGNSVLARGYYAGIGQRNLPEGASDEIKDHMGSVAKKLRNMGWTLRSGDAKGSDQAFQVGAGSDAVIYKARSKDKLSKTTSGKRVDFDKMSDEEHKVALDAVVRLHPNGRNLEGYSLDLMGRNYFQVMGTGGNVNSAFIACYADGTSHGTWQAIRIARENGIPVFNMAEYDNYDEWERDVIDAATRADNGELRSDAISADQTPEVDEAIRALIMANPDLFMHFNMDSPAAFLESSYGKKMLQYADDPEMLGGIYTTMVFDYRMERINSLSEELLTHVETERIEDVWNDLMFAKDELSSASAVWHGIIREFEAEASDNIKSFFQTMVEYTHATSNLKSYEPKQYALDSEGKVIEYGWGAGVTKDAADFWRNPGNHDSLRSVIEDLDMDRKTKWNVIVDVVRYWEKDAYIKSYEIGYQMEIANDSTFSIGGAPGKAALRVHRDFEDAFNKWSKRSQVRLREDVDRARTEFDHTHRPGINPLTHAIQRLDEEPWELVAIDSLMYADSILSVYDKTYSQTEKASQNPWTNAIYAALSYQQLGGYMNDVTRTDDRLLGLMSADSITVHDIIHLFAHPEEEITVYNKVGEWGVINRDILLKSELGDLSGDIEADMWEFFSREPRIASAIRRHSACVLQDSDGTGYLGASNSIHDTIARLNFGSTKQLDHVKYLMRDHPGYAAIISLALPGKNLVTRTARHRVKQIEDYFSYQLYVAASAVKDGWSASEVAPIILSDMGITRENLRSALRSDYDTFLEKQGLDAYKYTVTSKNGEQILESEYDADLTYDYAVDRVVTYINEIIDGGVQLGISSIEEPSVLNPLEKITSFHDSNNEPTFLSNFYETPITFDGITYRNAEAAFQAQKCENNNDKLQFINLTGKQAKSLGKKVKLRDDWDEVKIGIMREVIHAKFSNPEMRNKLEETRGSELIEGNTWGDRFWGVSRGIGENHLGKILMEERGEEFTGPDAVSAAAFWDTVQELSGAKTAVSTGIEGSETYKFAEWASHIHARDNYADLETLDETNDIDEQWDGAWTSLTNFDGSPVTLITASNGGWDANQGVRFEMTILNSDNKPETRTYYLNPTESDFSFADAKIDASRHMGTEVNEIVVMVPEGYQLKDRSTDSHGVQVASLFAYLVSKRSNGAEAFNLKAKKAGIDGKDSVTKKLPGGKHKADANYIDTLSRLRSIAEAQDVRAAQMELARMMLEENKEIGYKDLTLANYMSIAELMLIEGADGKLYLRSLEMLLSAIKYRIGFKVDEMNEEQLSQAVNDIVHDNSENGVGIAGMTSIEAFDNFRPASRAMQYNAIRQSSSVWARNYDIMSQIASDARDQGIEPLSVQETRNLDSRLSYDVYGDLSEYDNIDGKKLNSILSGYNVVGVIGGSKHFVDVHLAVGPSNVLYIGSNRVGPLDPVTKEFTDPVSDEVIRNYCTLAKDLGMTIVCHQDSYSSLPDFLRKDAVPILDEEGNDLNNVLIPCFDMKLNGSESTPYKPRFAMAQVDYSMYVASAEDSTNEFGLGDAEAQALRHLTDNMSMRDARSEQVTAANLFPNVFGNEAYKDCDFRVGLASGTEIKNLIVDGVKCTIDYGVIPDGVGAEQHIKNVSNAIERYRSRWGLANADGMMMGMDDCVPGDIVGWAEVAIIHPDGNTQYVLAPIIPFPLHGVKRQPSSYSVENLGPVDDDNTLFAVDWENRTELTNEFVKYFDSSGGANKGMISLSQALDESRTLLDGTPLDVYIAKASTDSRKVGTDRRIKTMITLMTLARLHGYNFARKPDGTPNEDAFPENEELRERLAQERIPASEWKDMLRQNVRFVTDDNLNAFITYECNKVLENGGNPSDYLANVFENPETGEKTETHVMWEFEAMFDQGLNYEDGLLKFLAFVNPIDPNSEHVTQFCPNGIEDMTTDALFRLYRDNNGMVEGYDHGVLQVRVPHRLGDNKMAYMWDNVYIGMSFFGEEYSGFSRPNVDGASNFLDGTNTMSMYGKTPKASSAKKKAQWATSDIGRLHGNGSYEKMPAE